MFDHLGINCSDITKSKAFYDKALAVFGYKALMGADGIYWGYGADKPSFWIAATAPGKDVSKGVHISFQATSRAQVDEFYAGAMAAGGVDNGKPGLRAEYHPAYYGAFVMDPDGNNVEAVSHKPE